LIKPIKGRFDLAWLELDGIAVEFKPINKSPSDLYGIHRSRI
jgi:hypothetical protein